MLETDEADLEYNDGAFQGVISMNFCHMATATFSGMLDLTPMQ